jgi:hypothetical protein
MKLLRYLLAATLFVFQLVQTLGKKLRHPSQGTRNYRHPHPDPSYNPLPQTYWTGPRYNFAENTGHKYKGYNARLSNIHHYMDTTKTLADRAHAHEPHHQ